MYTSCAHMLLPLPAQSQVDGAIEYDYNGNGSQNNYEKSQNHAGLTSRFN